MTVYLSGLLPDEILSTVGFEQPFRAKQVYDWIVRGTSDFSGMTNLPAVERERLSARFGRLRSSSVSSEFKDEDGSLKLQIRLRDGAAVECVILEDIEGRKTACLSSQVGCPMGCQFCRTGQLGFLRNLGPDEILEQYYFLKERRGFISNVVFMGMGEPLLNLEALRTSIAILSDPQGIGMSLRKITISTSGIVPGILDIAENGPKVRLAVSLTTADEAMRTELMPVNKSWNLEVLKAALVEYQAKTGERITLEAVLTGNRNASVESARALVRWVKPLKAQVNLIPWNVVPGLPFETPTNAQVKAFTEVLEKAGLVAVQRMHRGRGVMGACGQLGDTLTADPESRQQES
ncbi:MAG: 23S rRNA (adenine(2503)-C(2))-methyltransferase RlmN [Spirochaetae bacterium HGW-Spirochaetae-9]|nr:MAG: 23S rRNA (adenine(2503)-C(2))-methyltransferase RlmN [Spirochaetae bacterium HGW-Spirochaetae-9]